jgi:Gas vesicle synthesis protein GvpL/GvpF
MPVCVYAVVPATVRWGRKWRGVQGEFLKAVPCGDAAVVVGTIAAATPPDRAHLERHDTLMRAIVSAMPAALPARFGLIVRDVDRVHELVEASGISFRDALRLVSGREQMTLRIRLSNKPRSSREARRSSPTTGPGQRYLATRMVRSRLPQDPVLRSLRRRLASLVREERFRLKDNTATIYHLIDRGQSSVYLTVVRAFSDRHRGVQLTASGPFPPYAFGPGINE